MEPIDQAEMEAEAVVTALGMGVWMGVGGRKRSRTVQCLRTAYRVVGRRYRVKHGL
jgi:hypothetical protein